MNNFRLAFVQLGCPSYKREMFEALEKLPGLHLSLFVGDKHPDGHAPNGDMTGLEYCLLRNKIVRLLGLQLVWQSINKEICANNFDLIILPEGVLYFSNYVLMLRAFLAGTPVGFYSHGYNHQRKKSILSGLLERLRRFVHRRAAVIITYSQTGADFILQSNPAMAGRVFVALNTLNVRAIDESIAHLDAAALQQMRESWGFGPDDVVLAFAGRISVEKNPEFVLAAVQQLRAEGLPVRALFIGDGPALSELVARLKCMPDDVRRSIKFLGRVPATIVGPYLKAADISVMPGMTGLAVVHALAVGRPYVTVESPLHSPEIEYLQPGINGLITKDNLQSFVAGLRYLVCDSSARESMGGAGRNFALRELGIERQMAGFEQAITNIRKINFE